MTKASQDHEGELPKTMSSDQATGVTNPNEDRNDQKRTGRRQGQDHGIRPDDLNSENDQGAA